jgi:transposase
MEPPMRKQNQRRPHNDLSRSLKPLSLNHTLIAVIELSQKSWLVAGIIPGVERQPFEEVRVQRGRTIELDRSMAEGSEEGRLHS